MATKKTSSKPKESFMSKYGVFIVIIGLLAIFLIIALVSGSGKDKSKNSSNKAGDVTSIESSKWVEKSKEDNVMATVFAQTTCSWCEKFKPVVKEVIGETGATIYWIDVDVIPEEDFASFGEAYSELQDFGTPYTIITKAGKKVDEISGYVEKDELIDTLKENGIIK